LKNYPVKNSWQEWFANTLELLSARPGRFGLIIRNAYTAASIAALCERNISSVNLGLLATSFTSQPDELALSDSIGEAILLTDIAVLFDRESPVKPVPFLRVLARTGPRLAIWPGDSDGSEFEYGNLASNHRASWTPENALILTPISRDYPDEVPFEERWIN
jgi:hypothetical protein